jgi:hypothetical protein
MPEGFWVGDPHDIGSRVEPSTQLDAVFGDDRVNLSDESFTAAGVGRLAVIEAIVETVRSAEFGDKPSRLTSLRVRRWRARRPVEGEAVHRVIWQTEDNFYGDASLIDVRPGDRMSWVLDRARRYWEQDIVDDDYTEFLVTTPIRVIEKR